MNQSQSDPAKTKSKRRWFQFSLRTLLLILTVFALWLGVQVNRASKQRQAVRAIRELGGRVTYDYEVTGSGDPAGPEWLRKLVGHDYFASVVFINLVATHTTDADLVHLKGLTSLQGLSLLGTQVTDAGLGHVGALTNLETLNLSLTHVTDAGLAHLRQLTKLQRLDLSHMSVTDAGIDALRKTFPDVEIRRDPGIDFPMMRAERLR